MSTPDSQGRSPREEMLHLLSLSATMAGLSITGVTLFHTVGKAVSLSTIADEILAVCALLFLFCSYSAFWSLRTKSVRIARQLEKIADVLFAIGLTGMVGAGTVMVFTVW